MNDNYRNHSAELKKAMEGLEPWYGQIEEVVKHLKEAFAAGKRVYVAGNGGSATLAQHLSDEMVGRYESDRPAYPVIALTADSAVLTVIGNDYGYENIFKRQLEALGQTGDIFMGFSTSGTSKNIITAAETARERGMIVITFTGQTGALKDMADVAVVSPAKATSRIQELDLHAIHLICEAFEPERKQRRLGMDRIEEILGGFASKRILVIGDVMMDQYLSGSVDRINPEAPVPVLHAKQEREVTGGAGNAAKKAISVQEVVKMIANFYNIEEVSIYEKTRRKEVVRPRQVIMFLLREDFHISFPTIGDKLGGRDHTTVIHSCEKIKNDLLSDSILSQEIHQIRLMLK